MLAFVGKAGELVDGVAVFSIQAGVMFGAVPIVQRVHFIDAVGRLPDCQRKWGQDVVELLAPLPERVLVGDPGIGI